MASDTIYELDSDPQMEIKYALLSNLSLSANPTGFLCILHKACTLFGSEILSHILSMGLIN